MTCAELCNWMREGKPRGEFRKAFATMACDAVLAGKVVIPAGTPVKVVMASRFGDVGVTTDLSADSGYCYRTNCVEGCDVLTGKTIQAREELKDIKPIR